MRSFRRLALSIAITAIAIAASLSSTGWAAPAVWSGYTYSFASTFSVPDEDEITPNVTIARQVTGGIYNSASESLYTVELSPEYTLWATKFNNPLAPLIAATEWPELEFTDWRNAYGGAGVLATNIVAADGNAVVYLTLDDVYLDVKFTQWGAGFSSGGEFSYLRGEPPIVPEPTTLLLVATGVLALATRRRRK
jgi:hypothetical protein